MAPPPSGCRIARNRCKLRDQRFDPKFVYEREVIELGLERSVAIQPSIWTAGVGVDRNCHDLLTGSEDLNLLTGSDDLNLPDHALWEA